MSEKNKRFAKSIIACIDNGMSLIEDAKILIDWERYSTSLALAVLAQEEFAKAFMLHLVEEKTIPWSDEVRRSITNHECKHLVGILMEWLGVPFEQALERSKASLAGEKLEFLPSDVAKAINIFRHKKIQYFRDGYCEKEPEWDGIARKIAGGYVDRRKQAALYVSISKDGQVATSPKTVGCQQALKEIEQAERYCELANDAHRKLILSRREYGLLKESLAIVFSYGEAE